MSPAGPRTGPQSCGTQRHSESSEDGRWPRTGGGPTCAPSPSTRWRCRPRWGGGGAGTAAGPPPRSPHPRTPSGDGRRSLPGGVWRHRRHHQHHRRLPGPDPGVQAQGFCPRGSGPGVQTQGFWPGGSDPSPVSPAAEVLDSVMAAVVLPSAGLVPLQSQPHT